MEFSKYDDVVVNRRGEARFMGRRFPCAIGKNGFRKKKIEGDGATPVGKFEFEYGLFRPDRVERPSGKLDWRPISPTLGWSDDVCDPRYNQPVQRPHPYSHEKLRRPDPLYDLIVVLNINRNPAVPGRGSALFLHIWRKPRHPTEGCIAFSYSTLLFIVERCSSRHRLLVY